MSGFRIDTLPDWRFRGDEVALNVYKFWAKHVLGPTVELTGMNPEELRDEIEKAAQQLQADLDRKLKSPNS